MHRKWWEYTPCPDCDRCIFCETCHGAGVIATPRETVTATDLWGEYNQLADRYRWQRYPVPAPLIERLALVTPKGQPAPATSRGTP